MSATYVYAVRYGGVHLHYFDGLDHVMDDMGTLQHAGWDQRCVFMRQALHEVDDAALRAYWPAEMFPAAPCTKRVVAPEQVRALRRIEAKLERWELQHLRQLAAEQAERIQELERACTDAKRCAELWGDIAREAQDALAESGIGAMGITRQGAAVFVPAALEWHPA